MVTRCIVCDEPAGSREHVFPAAFGGRRMNKGIYCETHNKGLGHHVNELLKVLSYFNASLGVRSDHHVVPKPHLIETPEGERYQLLEDNIQIAPPRPLTETPELIGREATLAFSTIAQRDKWITQQKALGFEFTSVAQGPSRTEYFTTPFRQHFEFGSEPFRRAIAYLALTHLAHYFPDVARQEGLSSFIKCIMGEEVVGHRVWWVDPALVSIPTSKSFQSVHSVVISPSEETGRVTALITFFGHLCLGVDLGATNIGYKEIITTLIDPLSERAGPEKDILVIREESTLNLPSPDDGKVYISQVVNGKRENPVAQILTSLQKRHLNALAHRLLPQLKSTHGKAKHEQWDVVQKLIDEQGQRILNLLARGITMVLEEGIPLPAPMLAALENAIVEDPDSAHGLAEKTMHYLSLAKAAVTQEIIRHLDEGTLDEEKLILLLADGPGIATITKPVMHEVINSTPLR